MGRSTATVLFADDAPDITRRLAELLSGLPIEIVGMPRDGEETLRHFDAVAPDIAIVDLQMPKKNGLQVTSEIRKRGGKTLLILLTNLDSPEFHERAMRAGADHFLSKRTQISRVREIVEDFLSTNA